MVKIVDIMVIFNGLAKKTVFFIKNIQKDLHHDDSFAKIRANKVYV